MKNKTYIKLIWSIVIGAAVSGSLASAEIRNAKSYSCNAYNPLTGFATVTFDAKTRRKSGGAEIRYGWLTTPARGGALSYDTASPLNFPHAVMETKVNGNVVPVYMDLLRPTEHKSKEVVLAGLTYVPVSGFSSPWIAAYSGTLGHLSALAPLPAGYVATSVVTCRVSFL